MNEKITHPHLFLYAKGFYKKGKSHNSYENIVADLKVLFKHESYIQLYTTQEVAMCLLSALDKYNFEWLKSFNLLSEIHNNMSLKEYDIWTAICAHIVSSINHKTDIEWLRSFKFPKPDPNILPLNPKSTVKLNFIE